MERKGTKVIKQKINYFIIIAKLTTLGFEFYEELKGNIEVWYNPTTGKKFSIERELKNITETMFEAILTHAGITLKEFDSI